MSRQDIKVVLNETCLEDPQLISDLYHLLVLEACSNKDKVESFPQTSMLLTTTDSNLGVLPVISQSVRLYETITVKSLAQLDEYYRGLFPNLTKRLTSDTPIVGTVRHAWWPLMDPAKEYLLAKDALKGRPVNYRITSNTGNAKWVSRFHKSLGIGSRISPSNSHSHIWLYGDMVTETCIPQGLRDLLDEFFTMPNFDLNHFSLSQVYYKDAPITLKVFSDSHLSDMLRDQITTGID